MAVRVPIVLFLAGVTGHAQAQPAETGGWLIEVIGKPVSPTNPTTTVRVSATFPQNLGAFFTGKCDINSTDPNGSFSQICVPPPFPCRPMGCAGLHPGTPQNGGIVQAIFTQTGIGGCLPAPANPLGVFEAQWTTTDFTPRQVRLETATTPWYHVYTSPGPHALSVDLVAQGLFRHGSAVIEVTSGCYADCDTSTGLGALDIFDFLCFQNGYAESSAYACDCDTSTGAGVCDVFDFLCYQGRYAAGCP